MRIVALMEPFQRFSFRRVKRLKPLFLIPASHTGLKPGANEKKPVCVSLGCNRPLSANKSVSRNEPHVFPKQDTRRRKVRKNAIERLVWSIE